MLNKSILKSKIADIRKDTKSLRGRIQTILANTAAHVFVHGDVTLLDELFRATKGTNQKLMAKYIQDNCYATLQKSGVFKSNRKARKADGFIAGETNETHGGAIVKKLMEADPWFTKAESTKAIKKALDIAKHLETLNKKIEAAIESGEVIEFDKERVAENMARLNQNTAFRVA
tara:strand:+ start:19 stop:540 length:522 start_codon:yes stop_codon:yes gene_type:complete